MKPDTKKAASGGSKVSEASSMVLPEATEKAAVQIVGIEEIPEPEVTVNATRRRFTAQYKRSILKEVDACKEPGCLGSLLRREGLYASHIKTWRHQMEESAQTALTPRKRGRKGSCNSPLLEENERLRKDNDRLAKRLRQAEIIIDVQKKISMMLNIPQESIAEGGNL
jgi:transposase-like protein